MDRAAESYFNIQFTTQVEQTFIGLARNTSFFTEAPKYCLVLLLALGFDWSFFKRKKIEIVLLVTMLTTFSFTGVLAVIILVFVDYSLKTAGEIANRKATVRALIWPFLIAGGLLVGLTLLSAKIETSSGIGRIGDFVVCFSVGMKHPLFGWGFLDNDYLSNVLHSSRLASGVGNTMGLSNSICQIFVDGGLYLLLFYLTTICSYVFAGHKYKWRELTALGIVFLYLFVTTYFAYTGIMFMILAGGLCLCHFAIDDEDVLSIY